MKKIIITIAVLCGSIVSNKCYCQKAGEKLVTKGLAEAGIGHYQQAIADYNAAILLFKHNKKRLAWVYGNRASAEANLKQRHKALDDCAMVQSLSRKNYHVYIVLGYVYGDSGLYEKSIDYYTKVIPLIKKGGMDNEDSEVLAVTYALRGWQYVEVGLLQQSIDDYNKALLFYRDNTEVKLCEIYDGRGFTEYRLKEYQQAINDETKAIALDSTDANAYVDRAITYLPDNNVPRAISDFKHALKIDTDEDDKAYCLYFIGDSATAITTIKHKLSHDADNSQDQMNDSYTLACILSLMNKTTEALSYLKKAIQDGQSINYASGDPDLDNIKNQPQFLELTK